MPGRNEKLGILLSVPPEEPGFVHGLRLADAGLKSGVEVYLYCIDAAVMGLANNELQSLKGRGLKLFACAQSARRRNVPLQAQAVFSGLSTLSSLIAGADRFVSFN